MGRTRRARTTIEELRSRLGLAEKNKNELLRYAWKIKKKYIRGEISYSYYIEIFQIKRDGKTLREWISYYDDYINDCKKRIKEEKKVVFKNRALTILFSLVFISLLIFLSFHFQPRFVGFAVKGPSQVFSQQLNLQFSESTDYEWLPENLGQLISAKISGSIENFDLNSDTEQIKVYLDDLLIFDSSKIKEKQETGLTGTGSAVTGGAVTELERGNMFRFLISASPLQIILSTKTGRDFISKNIFLRLTGRVAEPLPETEQTEESYSESSGETSTETQEDSSPSQEESLPSETEESYSEETTQIEEAPAETQEDSSPSQTEEEPLPSEQSEEPSMPSEQSEEPSVETPTEEAPTPEAENVTIPEVPSEENITEPIPEPEIPEQAIIQFTDICEETCDLDDLNLNKTSYTLRIEITNNLNNTNTKLNINEIKYEIKPFEVVTIPEINITIPENITELNITKKINITEENVTIETTQYQAVLGQSVKWKKQIKPENTGNLTIKLPKDAENIQVNKIKKSDSEETTQIEEAPTETQEETNLSQTEEEFSVSENKQDITSKVTITGAAVKNQSDSFLIRFFNSISNFFKRVFNRIFSALTGRAIEPISEEIDVEIEIDELNIGYEIEYETPAPYATEQEMTRGKEVTIVGPDSVHYENVLVFTNLPQEVPKNNIRLYRTTDGIRELVEITNYIDENNNGLIDRIEWLVPSLSEQTYELEIVIYDAEHLDENREFIANIYSYVNETDGITYTIPENEYVRAYFERNLTSENKIDVYVTNSEPAKIEVYEENSEVVVGSISISREGRYYISLDFEGSQSIFDLKSVGGNVVYDYIHDAYDDVILALSPDCRWQLNNTVDDDISGLDGETEPTSYVSNIIPESDATYCGYFDGSTQVDVGTDNIFGGDDATVKAMSFWVNFETIDSTKRCMWGEGGTVNSMVFHTYLDGSTPTLYFAVNEDSGSTTDYVSAEVATGTLYHVMGILDCGTEYMYLYINGVLADSLDLTTSDNICDDDNYFTSHGCGVSLIGLDCAFLDYTGSQMSGSVFAGTIADVVYWDDPATTPDGDDAAAIYNAGIGGGTDEEYPQFSNYNDNNGSLVVSGTATFNVTLLSTNGTVYLQINNTNITATNYSSNPTIFNASTTFTSAGDYTYYWGAWGNGSSNNFNVSNAQYYTVNASVPDTEYPKFSNPTSSPLNNATYSFGASYQLNITILSTNTTVGVQFNITNYTASNLSNVFSVSVDGLSVGNYSYYWWAYGNGSQHNYNTSSIYYYNITQATGEINGTINGIQGNFTAVNGTATQNIWINATNKTGYGTGKIYVNGTAYNSGTMPLANLTNLSIGFYNITFIYDGNTNYSSDIDVWWVNVTVAPIGTIDLDVLYPTDLSQILNASQNLFFNVTVRVTCRNADCGEVNVSLDPLELGTNCGFVETAPTEDPGGSADFIDNYADSIHDTSPATATKITEVGWWCDTESEETNFEVGLYTDEGNDEPETRLYVDDTNAKGTDTGWKTVTVDWDIDPSTAYWIAIQVDNTNTDTKSDYASSGGTGEAYKSSDTLPEDWGTSDTTVSSGMAAFYAVWEAAGEGTKSGLVNTTVGATPFYTNESNPRNITLNKDESQTIVFWVNATGDIGTNHTFYAYANLTSDMSISNITNTWNVSIIGADEEYPKFSNPTSSPLNNATYSFGASYQLNITILSTNTTVGVQFNITNYTASNLSNVFSVSVDGLSVGNYSYYWWAYGNGSSTNYNTSSIYYYNITQATGEINGTINGTQGNFTAVNGTATQNIWINATNKTGYGTGKIYVNGTAYNSGDMPLANLTNLSIGFYNITFIYDGNTNYSSDIDVWWVNITPDTIYPQFSNYKDNNATLVGSGVGTFNVTITNTNGTVYLQINGNNISATNYSSNPTIFNASYAFTSSGSYTYYWGAWGNGTAHNLNTSIARYYFVNASAPTPPDISFVNPSPPNGITTPNTSVIFNVSITETDLSKVIWNWNGTNYTIYNDSLVFMVNLDNVSALGESDTHVVDLSNYSNNGTVSSVPWTSSGKYGGAFSFDGDGYINFGHDASIAFDSTKDMTYSLWVYLTGTPGDYDGFISDEDAGGDTGWDLNYVDSTPDRLGIWNDDLGDDYSLPLIDEGVWYNIVIVFDYDGSATDLYVYYDGTLVTTENDQTFASSTGSLALGGDGGGESYQLDNAIIDEVRIWNRALTSAEINQSYMSNLYKYDTNEWVLYVNQSKTPDSGLSNGTYTYFASAVSDVGSNQTETRQITIGEAPTDTTPPDINFTTPTPSNGSTQSATNVEIRVNITETDLGNVIWNWNGTNYTIYDDSLVLMYNLNNVSALGENDTYVVDLSNYSNNGTVMNGAVVNTTDCKFGNCFKFNGDDDYIQASASMTLENITVSAWVKTADASCCTSEYYTIFDIDDYDPSFSIYNGAPLVYHGGYRTSSGSGTVADGEWHHVVFVIEHYYSASGRVLYYIDGVYDGTSGDYSWSDLSVDTEFLVGYNNYPSEYWNGSIDEVRVWNRNLSATEVQELYFMNLQKYDIDKWSLYVNQSKNSTDGLDDGTYTYQAFASDSIGNWNQTEIRYITIGGAAENNAPNITFVSTISATNPIENTSRAIVFNFTVDDPDGASDINISSARAYFQKTDQSTRSNLSCLNIEADGTNMNFTCSIDMWYFDINGTWTINVTVEDNSSVEAQNASSSFTYNLLKAIVISPSQINFSAVIGGTNQTATNDPTVINNTGNYNATGKIAITGLNLYGEVFDLYFLGVANISADIDTGGTCSGADCLECDGTALINGSDATISNSVLERGNLSIGSGTAQEQLYYCIKQVPPGIPSQTYSTSQVGAWTIKILLAAVIPASRRKKKKKKQKNIEDDKLLETINLLVEELREKHKLSKAETMNLVIKELRKKYKLTRREIMELSEVKKVQIPATIFSKELGVLESLVKYMKENLNMSYKGIAEELGRDERTVWSAYKKAKEKQPESLKIEETDTFLPISIFENKELTVLESMIIYLKEKGMKYSEIADLLNRDQRNIWTIYTRAVKKLKENEKEK